MRKGGLCPCPCCLMPKSKLDKMGSFLDTKFWRHASNIRKFLLDKVTKARQKIYNLAVGISGRAVQNLLKPSSSVPTMVRQYNSLCLVLRLCIFTTCHQNAFNRCL